jgi:putative ABC transport system substrate-binding protein
VTRAPGFFVAAALGLFVWSLSADAQQPTRIPQVGILSDERCSWPESFKPIAQGLRDLGYVEGRNIAFERRCADHKNEILPGLAAELVSLQPDVILAIGTLAARAAKSATQTIPIVFARVGDPIAYGLVPGLPRPGGNLTGLSLQLLDTAAKRLEFLVTAVPEAKRVGTLWDASYLPTAEAELRQIEAASRSLNVEIVPADVRSPKDFEPALRALAEQGATVVINISSPPIANNMPKLFDLLVKTRLPSMCWARPTAAAGCLMSYGPSDPDMWRRVGAYVDKILKSAKPADLPVEQPMKFELVINLNTAKALGLTIPPLLLVRADQVIE